MGKTDWSLVEADFLATGLSYARLAEKHGLSRSTVQKKAAAEHWQERLRKARGRGAATEILEPADLALEIRQSRRMRLEDTADRMMEKLNRSVEELGPDDTDTLSKLVRTLKDLRELQGLQKDALDLAEQQARIAKLRNQVRDTESESAGGVLLIPAVEGELRPPTEERGARRGKELSREDQP